MLVCAHAMKASLALLQPQLVDTDVKASGRVAIGTVQGDLHDIGKNLVAMMLQGSGFEVEDLGVDVYPERFVEAARDGVDVIAMSALLTTTMTNMQRVVEAISDAGLRTSVRIVVGGAPITQTLLRRDRRRRLRKDGLERGAHGQGCAWPRGVRRWPSRHSALGSSSSRSAAAPSSTAA